MREQIERFTDELRFAFEQINDDTLLDKILEQKNAVIAHLNNAVETRQVDLTKTKSSLAELERKLKSVLQEHQTVVKDLNKKLDRNLNLVSMLTRQLRRRWRPQRLLRSALNARGSAGALIEADEVRSWNGIRRWDTRCATAQVAGWLITHPTKKTAEPADLLVEVADVGVHCTHRPVDQIPGYVPCAIAALLRPHGRDFAGLSLLSGETHVAEGRFDLANAASVQATPQDGLSAVVVRAHRYARDWVKCELVFSLAQTPPGMRARVESRRDLSEPSEFKGVVGLGIGIADLQIGYRCIEG